MPPEPFLDPLALDFTRLELTPEQIREWNPHRFEMEQLSGVVLMDFERRLVAGFRDVRGDEFWVRGHVPGRPLFPGILMLEAGAQLCSLYYTIAHKDEPRRFFGFGGIDGVKFRGTVVPGDRLVLIARNNELRTRRAVFEVQGFVADRMVFEAKITGLIV